MKHNTPIRISLLDFKCIDNEGKMMWDEFRT